MSSPRIDSHERIEANDWSLLVGWIMEEARHLCVSYMTTPGALFRPRKRGQKTAAARKALVDSVRASWRQDPGRGQPNMIRLYHVGSANIPEDAEPLSWPIIAGMLGYADHTGAMRTHGRPK